jgi:hypothetical protein
MVGDAEIGPDQRDVLLAVYPRRAEEIETPVLSATP